MCLSMCVYIFACVYVLCDCTYVFCRCVCMPESWALSPEPTFFLRQGSGAQQTGLAVEEKAPGVCCGVLVSEFSDKCLFNGGRKLSLLGTTVSMPGFAHVCVLLSMVFLSNRL